MLTVGSCFVNDKAFDKNVEYELIIEDSKYSKQFKIENSKGKVTMGNDSHIKIIYLN